MDPIPYTDPYKGVCLAPVLLEPLTDVLRMGIRSIAGLGRSRIGDTDLSPGPYTDPYPGILGGIR